MTSFQKGKLAIWGDFQGIPGVTRPCKGRNGVQKIENRGDIIYGCSHTHKALLTRKKLVKLFLASNKSAVL